jgi:L-fuconolactonase
MITRNSAITRRAVLGTCAKLIGSALVSGAAVPFHSRVPIIDAHSHFYNPARSGAGQANSPGIAHPDTPEAYQEMVEPLGVRGTIVIESSTWIEDNQWILDLAKHHKIIVGFVGHLVPGAPQFRQQLLRFCKNPIFRGIRYGNLWGGDIGRALQQPDFLSDMKFLAEADLELDAVLDPPGHTPVLGDVLNLSNNVPNLRIVIDHLPFYVGEGGGRAEYLVALRELQKHPQVYAKISGILREVGGRVPDDVNFYRPALDELWDTFGPDRLIYGSNWPPSERLAPYGTVLRVAREYFAEKGESAGRKFFWNNSMRAYRWAQRV